MICVTGEELVRIAADDLRKETELLPPASAPKDNNSNTVTNKQYASRGPAWAIVAEAYDWLAGVYGYMELLAPRIVTVDSVFGIAFTNLQGEEYMADYYMPFMVHKYLVERNASPMTTRWMCMSPQSVTICDSGKAYIGRLRCEVKGKLSAGQPDDERWHRCVVTA